MENVKGLKNGFIKKCLRYTCAEIYVQFVHRMSV